MLQLEIILVMNGHPMKHKLILLILGISLLMAACGMSTEPAASETPAASPTPDLCSAENLPLEVAKANKLMREFDDYSSLASHTLQSQLIQLIPDMQRVLRDTQDLQVPPCMDTLKKLEMAHMSLVIQTLMAFMDNTDVQVINAGIAQARDLHAKYDVELARLLGITLVPRPTSPAGTAVPADPNVAPSATQPISAIVTNPGPNGVNLRSAPGLNAPETGVLDALASTNALGKSADEQWIQVQNPTLPGQTAWVYASLVQLSVPISQLPVISQ
jgi:hypothetical protein